jgi:lysophospholipase L1-like esterase
MQNSHRLKVCAVSDSLTNEGPDNWLGMVAAADERIIPVAEAHGGWTTRSYFKSKFDGVAFAKAPSDADVFIILLGSNNLFEAEGGSDAAVAEAVEGVRKVAEHVLKISPRAGIVLAAPPTVCLRNNHNPTPKPTRRIDDSSPAYLAKLSTAYRDLAAREGWKFVDLYPLLSDSDFLDAAHPNERGNRKIAEAIGKALR